VRLKLYSSKRGVVEPNLVSIQAGDLDMLPTVLVCPLLERADPTPVRVEVDCSGSRWVTLCDLARPIHRRGLEAIGELSEHDSRRAMDTFRLLLAR
jgi:mRNA-degrading endonuclease toxin of MazEF toxin-antitoxin module